MIPRVTQTCNQNTSYNELTVESWLLSKLGVPPTAVGKLSQQCLDAPLPWLLATPKFPTLFMRHSQPAHHKERHRAIPFVLCHRSGHGTPGIWRANSISFWLFVQRANLANICNDDRSLTPWFGETSPLPSPRLVLATSTFTYLSTILGPIVPKSGYICPGTRCSGKDRNLSKGIALKAHPLWQALD